MLEAVTPRPWAVAALAVALAAGVVIAGYLVVHHENHVYGDATVTLANCPETETVNCDLVNSSSWSELAGVPIAALAIPTYLLLLGLAAVARRSPEALAYAFGIGLLTVAYSAFLLFISKTRIGFLCLWCMRLYAVNLSIPILAAIASRRSPAALLRAAARDLRSWPPPMRRSAAAFVALLALTVAGDRALRSHVKAGAAAERERIEREGGPTVPAVPPATPEGDASSLGGWLIPDAMAAEPAKPAAAAAYKLAGPLRKIQHGKDGVTSAPFDLQARLGSGKPVALIFWAPGFAGSERVLITMAAWFAKEAPQFEVYAVSGRRDDQKDEEIQEAYALLDPAVGLPLLVDDAFVVSTALTVLDVPNVAVFSAKGALVVAKIKSTDQLLITEKGNVTAAEVMRQVARGVEVPQIQRMFPYYPAAEFQNRCAPAFRGKVFGTGAPFSFSGKSTAGRPTFVMFWSSTCPHCQVEIPQLVTWFKAHPGTIDLIGVTRIRRDQAGRPSHRAITEAYVKAQAIPWPIVEDVDGIVGNLYDNTATPTTYIVSPSGTVTEIWYYAHESGFDEAMEKAIAKAKAATAACTPRDTPGTERLAFSVLGPDGKRVELASLLDRPAVVHFWATWCKPCAEELPSLMKFRDDVEKSGAARVILVSTEGDADGKRIEQFQKTLGLDLRSYRAPKGGAADRIDLSYRLPRTFVVGPGGRVWTERQGRQDWTDPATVEAIRAYLAAAAGATR